MQVIISRLCNASLVYTYEPLMVNEHANTWNYPSTNSRAWLY